MLQGAVARKLDRFAGQAGAAAFGLVSSDYAFLCGTHVDAATLARAEALARQWGVHPHEVLIANGWVSAEDYARALAGTFGLDFRSEISAGELDPVHPGNTLRAASASGLLKQHAPNGGFVLAPDHQRPNDVAKTAEALRPERLTLAPAQSVRNALREHFADSIARLAVEDLHARRPDQSARQPLMAWQRYGPALAAVLFAVALLIDVETPIRALSILIALLFIPVIALRFVALGDLIGNRPRTAARAAPRIADAELPIYTILVALYREANVLPGLLRGLARLDYPVFRRCYTKPLT